LKEEGGRRPCQKGGPPLGNGKRNRGGKGGGEKEKAAEGDKKKAPMSCVRETGHSAHRCKHVPRGFNKRAEEERFGAAPCVHVADRGGGRLKAMMM
jgi:hypothetical protein